MAGLFNLHSSFPVLCQMGHCWRDAAQAPTPITLFLSDCGVNYPDDFDPADNWVINQIAEWANVEFEEVFMPMSDVNTQFNLLVASGDMPDLVETAWLRGDMRVPKKILS